MLFSKATQIVWYFLSYKTFLQSKMFPGMEDVPPAFATERPPNFDKNLPIITLKDIQVLNMSFKKFFRRNQKIPCKHFI